MGNLKFVYQLAPWTSTHGAAIAVRPREAVFGALPSYVFVDEASRLVGPAMMPLGRSFVCIQSGGKWGYDGDFGAWLASNARVLEDALFLVNDENQSFISRIEIANGVLSRVVSPGEGSVAALYLLDADPVPEPFPIELLVDFLDGARFYDDEVHDDTSAQVRAADALFARAPDRWEAWFHRGDLLLARKHAGAIDALETALAKLPADDRDDDTRALVELRLAHAYAAVDPVLARAFGERNRERWRIAASAEHTSYSNAATALEHLAELEAELDDADASLATTVDWLRAVGSGDDDRYAERFYLCACACAATGHLDAARAWLHASVALEPVRAAQAADEPLLQTLKPTR